MIIKIPVPALKLQKPIDITQANVELNKNYIRYTTEFTANEPIDKEDPDMGWKEQYNYLDVKVKKSEISGVEKSYIEISDVWGVYILSNIVDIKVFFENPEDCIKFFENVDKWLFNSEETI